MSNWLTVVTTIAGLIVGGLVTYFTSRATLRNQAEHAFDQTLRELRLPQYRALFHLTEAVPRQWILTNPPNREELLVLRKRFHEWYFSEQAGGMLLSQAARQAYFGLQNGRGEDKRTKLIDPEIHGQHIAPSTIRRPWSR
jgi:hypothetical protein